ncbi:peptidase domain-containing ABC transporter [Salmonella enterica subsp. arizonae str. CFSAN000560]|uniref:Peptidase domain-containing ABC transporter n=1 Tax=Salmonella enterica I TaxID=59201 RepID=A0A7T8FH33_SALET|nr:colicin V synthesis protein [Salmonella enterica subsp. arizonae serovar 62:z36:- str. RKS2983]EAO6001394.1 peptidase domain-containing ABC transporter [Salmonella enterica subsp. arizonae serovar 62:z36:-]ECG1413492.1 peptidase domain-containing ABC transporter [Salmonella enterica subsp. arizonae str. CFSAN000560]ECG9616313.1 peptidase domain-containing ABC transporter [Salmonella enterica]ECU0369497.1 peptidase domain-containing ABC transporter [Salmonella enterica subsp. enterica serovar
MNSEILKKYISRLEISLFRRVPVIHQTESSECGIACLAMVFGHYGKSIDLFSLRQQFNISSRGATLYSIRTIAVQMGMTVRALSLDLNELNVLRRPCILHWNFNHFVVLVSVKRNGFVLHDPARGRIIVSKAEASKCFTGIALELWPGSTFRRERVKKRLNLVTLINSIHGIKGALLKIFALSIVVEAIGLILPAGTQLVMDHALPAGDRGLLSMICISLMFFILLRATVSTSRAWISLIMGTLVNIQWQSGLFSHLLRLPLSYFERRKLGDIQSRFGSLNTLRTTFTTSMVGAIMDGIMVCGLLIMMLLYGKSLTWVVLGFTVVYIAIRLFTYTYYRQLSEEQLIMEARVSSYFMETLYGIAAVKMQGMTDRRHTHWFNLQTDAINTGIRVTKMDLFFGGLNIFISACEQTIILWLGISLVMDNEMTIGMFVAFGAYRMQFSDRISTLVGFLLQLRMMSLHNERISDIALNEQESVKPDIPVSEKITPVSLEVKSLTFRYDQQSMPVFSELNLTVSPGESVAIIGPSGSGKTTLMKVLCGLFKADSGQVLIDGNDIQQMGVNNYRKITGCVMQDDRLFSGTIRENICGFSENIDDEWMAECAKASFIHDTIMSMPMGYDTLTGELGEGLSGGQKQRLFIARALYRKPRILFMDEATSALDSKSEHYVNSAIKSLNITRIIIAHRESTIKSVDRIFSLT